MAAHEAANWTFASISPAPAGSPPFASLTDDQILMLHFLFSKTLHKAVRIIEEGGVYRLLAEPSGRTVFQVMGNPKDHQHYVCFPEHFCSCHAFFFDVVSRGHQLCCKHQLAARLASALQGSNGASQSRYSEKVERAERTKNKLRPPSGRRGERKQCRLTSSYEHFR